MLSFRGFILKCDLLNNLLVHRDFARAFGSFLVGQRNQFCLWSFRGQNRRAFVFWTWFRTPLFFNRLLRFWFLDGMSNSTIDTKLFRWNRSRQMFLRSLSRLLGRSFQRYFWIEILVQIIFIVTQIPRNVTGSTVKTFGSDRRSDRFVLVIFFDLNISLWHLLLELRSNFLPKMSLRFLKNYLWNHCMIHSKHNQNALF